MKSLGSDKLVKYGCDNNTWEKKYDRLKILNIGSTVGFKATYLDDKIKRFDIGLMVDFKPMTTQLKDGCSPDRDKHWFNTG